jgi:hypothetical protein
MAKFKPGDYFRDILTPANMGVINHIYHNSMIYREEYIIQWTAGACANRLDIFEVEYADAFWEQVNAIGQPINPKNNLLMSPDDLKAFQAWTSENRFPDKMYGDSSPSKIEKICSHSWATYHGFNDSFEYCTFCDEKKS